MDEKKVISEAEKLLENFFSLVGIEVGTELAFDGEVLSVELKTEEHAGLLIGHRGETLVALQMFLGIALKNKLGDWVRVNLNIGDWREKQEEYLENLAEQTAARAIETGEVQNLYNLNPAQRRVVHMKLSENDKIKTESEGEGKDRYLAVKAVDVGKTT